MLSVRRLGLFLFLFGGGESHGSESTPSPGHPEGDTVSPGADSLSFPWSRLRLPRYIVPLHYRLLLHPNLTKLSFTGSVQIQVDVQNNKNWVVLHSKDLQISSATILDENLAHLSDKVLPVLHNPSHEQIGIFSPRVLSSGQKYFLYMEFGVELADGFYRSSYTSSTGETRTLASTHFEPTSARMAFPCFDEPSFNATFSVRLRRSPEFISLSNMPVMETVELADGQMEDQFEESVKMSTYLVAFVVCDFKSVTGTTSSGVQGGLPSHRSHTLVTVPMEMWLSLLLRTMHTQGVLNTGADLWFRVTSVPGLSSLHPEVVEQSRACYTDGSWWICLPREGTHSVRCFSPCPARVLP